MDTLDQPWMLKRNAHEYTGAQAVEVTRLAGLMTAAYMHLHAAHPAIPFGGYYALGVRQDGISAIEHALTGNVTLFPTPLMTHSSTTLAMPRSMRLSPLFPRTATARPQGLRASSGRYPSLPGPIPRPPSTPSPFPALPPI
jgi:hypothetical protein